MIVHFQRSDRSRVWFDAEVAPDGSIPATSFWLHGTEYAMLSYDPAVGSEPFHIYVEAAGGGADYLLDLTGDAQPASFGDGIGAPLVVWREEAGGELHVLRSIQDA